MGRGLGLGEEWLLFAVMSLKVRILFAVTSCSHRDRKQPNVPSHHEPSRLPPVKGVQGACWKIYGSNVKQGVDQGGLLAGNLSSLTLDLLQFKI